MSNTITIDYVMGQVQGWFHNSMLAVYCKAVLRDMEASDGPGNLINRFRRVAPFIPSHIKGNIPLLCVGMAHQLPPPAQGGMPDWMAFTQAQLEAPSWLIEEMPQRDPIW